MSVDTNANKLVLASSAIVVGLFGMMVILSIGWIGYRTYSYESAMQTYRGDWARADQWRKHCESLGWNPDYYTIGKNIPIECTSNNSYPAKPSFRLF